MSTSWQGRYKRFSPCGLPFTERRFYFSHWPFKRRELHYPNTIFRRACFYENTPKNYYQGRTCVRSLLTSKSPRKCQLQIYCSNWFPDTGPGNRSTLTPALSITIRNYLFIHKTFYPKFYHGTSCIVCYYHDGFRCSSH